MTELAKWEELTYYMLKEETPTKHIILVVDQYGRKATYRLEQGFEILNELKAEDKVKAARMIRDMKDDFLDYWNEIKAKSQH